MQPEKECDQVEQAASSSNVWKGARWMFIGLLVVGTFLRLYHLGTPFLWIDEITVVDFAGDQQRTAGQIVSEIREAAFQGTTAQHMPFQYVWVNLFRHLYHRMHIPITSFWIRLPFALLGIATLPLAYVIGLRSYNRRVGLWAMGLFAVSFFLVYQSRDATSYAPLIFFQALMLAGIFDWLAVKSGSRLQRVAATLAVVLGAMGALFTHMTAWIMLGSTGLALFIVTACRGVQFYRSEHNLSWRVFRREFAVLILLAGAMLPFVPVLLSAYKNFYGMAALSGKAGETWSFSHTLYQLAYFGWGRRSGRLVSFVLVLACGVFSGLRNDRDRGRTGLWLSILFLSVVVFFRLLKGDYQPRYLAICVVPLLVLAGRGLEGITTCEHLHPGVLRVATPYVVGMVLASLLLAPYETLFKMKDKRAPFSQVWRWLNRELPPGGVYIWRSGYEMRTIPGYYPVPERQAAFVNYPSDQIPPPVRRQISDNARAFFDNNRQAVFLIDASDTSPLWQWPKTVFRSVDTVRNDEIHRLWRFGLSPHGLSFSNRPGFCIYHH
jgi:4-amino-4-deoxy-L-arabinose transferase-like glycosyltransferase